MLVILTEEESMEVTLSALLPRLGVTAFQIVTFRGVGDLEASLARRLRGWRDPNARFLILRDNDNGDCWNRKQRLLAHVAASGCTRPVKIRIVMQELEAWFLGDPQALVEAGLLRVRQRPAFLRSPEAEAQPEQRLRSLDPGYRKIGGAHRIAPYLDPSRNTAPSFLATIAAIRHMVDANGE
ncbi:MAG: DUF4276 family protein [Gemmobacter sp.]